MSADNGIYILKTKDQYRVAHLQAANDLWWSATEGDWRRIPSKRGKYVPIRIVEMWGGCKYTRSRCRALKIARTLAGSLPVCEYGISFITYNKTWKHILMDAEEYVKKEIGLLSEAKWRSPRME